MFLMINYIPGKMGQQVPILCSGRHAKRNKVSAAYWSNNGCFKL